MADKEERDKYALKGLEGYLDFWSLDKKEGRIIQTVPDSKRRDGKPWKHHLYLDDLKYADIPESTLVAGQMFSFDTEGEPDPKSKSGKRTKAINLKLIKKPDNKKGGHKVHEHDPKIGFVLTPISETLLEVFPNHPDGKAVNFTVRATGFGAAEAKLKQLDAEKSNEAVGTLKFSASGKPVELEVGYSGDSLDLMVRCDDLGTKDYATIWKRSS